MSRLFELPRPYAPSLDVLEIESAIKDVKAFFEDQLSSALDLRRVTAPLFVRSGQGLNDDLNGVERPVRFDVKDDGCVPVEIVQSLAKWKRLALKRYGFPTGTGLYTDMNAIRPDEELDNIHSVYVDQWDWEKIIDPAERTFAKLVEAVKAIYGAIAKTEFHVASQHARIRPILPEAIHVVTAEELAQRYPRLSPREREEEVCRERLAVFVAGIGAELSDGRSHDGRASDYDDWSTPNGEGSLGLNGDILVWNPVLGRSFELSSMGIRVDPEALRRQLRIREEEGRAELAFHRLLLGGELPQTIGGGIGQSRLCMFFLRTAHIGEVAVGIWPDTMVAACARQNITLL